jgi:hypothetical protein
MENLHFPFTAGEQPRLLHSGLISVEGARRTLVSRYECDLYLHCEVMLPGRHKLPAIHISSRSPQGGYLAGEMRHPQGCNANVCICFPCKVSRGGVNYVLVCWLCNWCHISTSLEENIQIKKLK